MMKMSKSIATVVGCCLSLGAYAQDSVEAVDLPENQKYFTQEYMQKFYDATFDIAEMKIKQIDDYQAQLPEEERFLNRRIATGGGFSGLFLWDSAFCILWAKYEPETMPLTGTLDNFYLLQEEDGFLCREFNKDGKAVWSKVHPISQNPPILSWAEWDLYNSGITDKARLEKILPNLKSNYEYIKRTFRTPTGLYFNDALGGGMDDLPRMPIDQDYSADIHAGIDFKKEYIIPEMAGLGDYVASRPLYCWNKQMDWIDFSAQMALNSLNIARMCEAIGDTEGAEYFYAEHQEIADLINEHLWDEERGFYFDNYKGNLIYRYHIGALWTLIAEVVPEDRIERVVSVIMDPNKFNTVNPVSTVAADEPEFPAGGYWINSTWPCTTYMVLRGLQANGQDEAALRLARKTYLAHAKVWENTGTVWENMRPDSLDEPRASGRDFCGWGALIPISVAKEFLGLE